MCDGSGEFTTHYQDNDGDGLGNNISEELCSGNVYIDWVENSYGSVSRGFTSPAFKKLSNFTFTFFWYRAILILGINAYPQKYFLFFFN